MRLVFAALSLFLFLGSNAQAQLRFLGGSGGELTYAVAGPLCTSSSVGGVASISDSTTNSLGGAISGGGSYHVFAVCENTGSSYVLTVASAPGSAGTSASIGSAVNGATAGYNLGVDANSNMTNVNPGRIDATRVCGNIGPGGLSQCVAPSPQIESGTSLLAISSPGVVSWAGPNFPTNGSPITIAGGVLPTGVTSGTVYYVVQTASQTSFNIASAPGGTPINFTGSTSGTQTITIAYDIAPFIPLMNQALCGNPTAMGCGRQLYFPVTAPQNPTAFFSSLPFDVSRYVELTCEGVANFGSASADVFFVFPAGINGFRADGAKASPWDIGASAISTFGGCGVRSQGATILPASTQWQQQATPNLTTIANPLGFLTSPTLPNPGFQTGDAIIAATNSKTWWDDFGLSLPMGETLTGASSSSLTLSVAPTPCPPFGTTSVANGGSGNCLASTSGFTVTAGNSPTGNATTWTITAPFAWPKNNKSSSTPATFAAPARVYLSGSLVGTVYGVGQIADIGGAAFAGSAGDTITFSNAGPPVLATMTTTAAKSWNAGDTAIFVNSCTISTNGSNRGAAGAAGSTITDTTTGKVIATNTAKACGLETTGTVGTNATLTCFTDNGGSCNPPAPNTWTGTGYVWGNIFHQTTAGTGSINVGDILSGTGVQSPATGNDSVAIAATGASTAPGDVAAFYLTDDLNAIQKQTFTTTQPYYVYSPRSLQLFRMPAAQAHSLSINVTSESGAGLLSIASPGVVTWSGAGFPVNNSAITFSGGVLPTGLTANVIYYVENASGTTFNVSSSAGGPALNFTGSTSGSQTITAYAPVTEDFSQPQNTVCTGVQLTNGSAVISLAGATCSGAALAVGANITAPQFGYTTTVLSISGNNYTLSQNAACTTSSSTNGTGCNAQALAATPQQSWNPGDMIDTQAYPFGTVIWTVTPSAGASSAVAPVRTYILHNALITAVQLPMSNVANGTYPAWSLPIGLDLLTALRANDMWISGFLIGENIPCSAGMGLLCADSVINNVDATNGLVGRFTTGDNTAGTSYQNNFYTYNFFADIVGLGTLGDWNPSDLSESQENFGTVLLPRLENCGNQNLTTIVAQYVAGDVWTCVNQTNPFITPPAMKGETSGSWLNISPLAASPKDSFIISPGVFKGQWKFTRGDLEPCTYIGNQIDGYALLEFAPTCTNSSNGAVGWSYDPGNGGIVLFANSVPLNWWQATPSYHWIGRFDAGSGNTMGLPIWQYGYGIGAANSEIYFEAAAARPADVATISATASSSWAQYDPTISLNAPCPAAPALASAMNIWDTTASKRVGAVTSCANTGGGGNGVVTLSGGGASVASSGSTDSLQFGLSMIGDEWNSTVAAPGGVVGWVNTINAGRSFYPFGPISNSSTQPDYTMQTVRSGSASNTDITGRVTLSVGTGSYSLGQTYTSAPNCLCNDVTTPGNACSVSESTTTLTFTGTGTDVVKYVCIGRN